MFDSGRRSQLWLQHLRRPTTRDGLLRGDVDFPLAETQALADELLEGSSPTLSRRRISANTQDGDHFFVGELGKLTDEFPTREAGILSCLHLLTFDQARGQLLRTKPSLDRADPFIKDRILVYLRCLILACRANYEACSDVEGRAAYELFTILNDDSGRRLPSVWAALQSIERDECTLTLPDDLVTKILSLSHYWTNLEAALEAATRERRWAEAYGLVAGLEKVVNLPRAERLLREMFSRYPMWAVWRPSVPRIRLWENQVLDPFRDQLGSVLDLEGPDQTGQQRPALRRSSYGKIELDAASSVSNGRFILDHLLHTLDRAIRVGPGAIDLFVSLCCEDHQLTWKALGQVESALDLKKDATAAKLASFVRALAPNATASAQMTAFTAALPLIRQSPKLQKCFGINVDLARRGPAVLCRVQGVFCDSVEDNSPSEQFGCRIQALAAALRESSWMHHEWQPEYVKMLQQLPSKEEIRAMFQGLLASPPGKRSSYLDLLAMRVGAARLRDSAEPLPTLDVPVVDPVMEMPLDMDRDQLRSAVRTMPNMNPGLAVACVQASQKEHDGFVRELGRYVYMTDCTDQVCVNVAKLLGNRAARGHRVADPWKNLLLHMMQQRPGGLLDRCGEALSEQSWLSWIESLRRLYGERHLGAAGGLGFKRETIAAWTTRKVGVGRSSSTDTTSTWASSNMGEDDVTVPLGGGTSPDRLPDWLVLPQR